jgi:hypothetical protein
MWRNLTPLKCKLDTKFHSTVTYQNDDNVSNILSRNTFVTGLFLFHSATTISNMDMLYIPRFIQDVWARYIIIRYLTFLHSPAFVC